MALLKTIPADRIIDGNRELAKILNRNECTISRWKSVGKLNYLMVGTSVYYDSENIFDTSRNYRDSKRKK